MHLNIFTTQIIVLLLQVEFVFINFLIERVKELLQHDEYTLSEIAYMMDYSSVAHLSRQFKSVTGLTPSEYLRGSRERLGLHEI